MRLRLPPKNRNQGIYWVRYYLDHVDKPSRSATKQPKITKQEEYRQLINELIACWPEPIESYPEPIQFYINHLYKILNLKRITSIHMDRIQGMIDILEEEYG